jgi:hypothetical protein
MYWGRTVLHTAKIHFEFENPGQGRGERPRRSWGIIIEDEAETVGKTLTEVWKPSPLMMFRGGAMLRSGLTQIY